MKKWLVLALLVLAVLAWAQTPGSLTLLPVGAVASCPTPSASANILCSTTTGWQISNAGAAYVPIPGTSSISFSQVTGTLAASQLPATATCTLSATIGTSNTVTISACH